MRIKTVSRLGALMAAIGLGSLASLAPVSARAESPGPALSTRSSDDVPPDDDRAARAVGASVEWGSARTLGGHAFPFPMFVPTSFATTYFGLRAGGYLRSVPDYPSASGSVTLEDVGFGEGLDFGVRFHERVAAQVSGYGVARLGTNIESLLGSGGQFEYGVSVSLLANWLRVDATGTQLSTRASLGTQGGQQIGVGSFASSLLTTVRDTIGNVKTRASDPQTPSTSELIEELEQALDTVTALFSQADDLLLTPYRGWRAELALAAAQAGGRFLGVQSSLGVAVIRSSASPSLFQGAQPTETIEVIETAVVPTLGIACDFDAAPLGVPLDAVVEYNPSFPRTHTVTTVAGTRSERTQWRAEHVLGGGLYYSGRTDLQLGMFVHAALGQEPVTAPVVSESGSKVAGEPDAAAVSGKPTVVGGQFVFRYVW